LEWNNFISVDRRPISWLGGNLNRSKLLITADTARPDFLVGNGNKQAVIIPILVACKILSAITRWLTALQLAAAISRALLDCDFP
jgi:hypothetical protein